MIGSDADMAQLHARRGMPVGPLQLVTQRSKRLTVVAGEKYHVKMQEFPAPDGVTQVVQMNR